jgi:hypothetical protein
MMISGTPSLLISAIFVLLLVLTLNHFDAQLPNANHYSTGHPWTVGHIPEYTPILIEKLSSIII